MITEVVTEAQFAEADGRCRDREQALAVAADVEDLRRQAAADLDELTRAAGEREDRLTEQLTAVRGELASTVADRDRIAAEAEKRWTETKNELETARKQLSEFTVDQQVAGIPSS